VNLAHRRRVRLDRRPAVTGQQEGHRAVPAGRTPHRRLRRPLAADPHRHPGALYGRRQEHDVVEDHVLAAEGYRLARPQQVQRGQALVQPGGQFRPVGGLAEAAELVGHRRA
jgi:hypothetical protein